MPFATEEIEEHIPRLRRYARALLGGASEADDLVQDCLERALGRRHLWRQKGGARAEDLRAWLFTVMHNLHANTRRRAHRRPDRTPLDEVAREPGAEGDQIDRLKMRDLSAALQSLPAEQREVLLLIAVEGFSYEDAARVTGAPVGTVMSRLSRARDRVRQLTDGETRPGIRRVK